MSGGLRARILAAALLLSAAPAAQAAWLESGNGTTPPITPFPTPWIVRPTPWPTPIYQPPWDDSARAVHSFLQSTSLGTPYGWGGLTIVPVMVLRSATGGWVEGL